MCLIPFKIGFRGYIEKIETTGFRGKGRMGVCRDDCLCMVAGSGNVSEALQEVSLQQKTLSPKP